MKVSLAHHGRMERRLELYEKLAAAEAQVAAGDRGRSLSRVMKDLRARLREQK